MINIIRSLRFRSIAYLSKFGVTSQFQVFEVQNRNFRSITQIIYGLLEIYSRFRQSDYIHITIFFAKYNTFELQ